MGEHEDKLDDLRKEIKEDINILRNEVIRIDKEQGTLNERVDHIKEAIGDLADKVTTYIDAVGKRRLKFIDAAIIAVITTGVGVLITYLAMNTGIK